MIAVIVYLAGIIAANLAFAYALNPANGFSLAVQLAVDAAICAAFIGLDIALRDILHERWRYRHLWWRMLGLIFTGACLSWGVSFLLYREAGDIVARVALASFLAFFASGVVDFLIYQRLQRRAWVVKVQASNTASALVDSLVFPLIAFGFPLMWPFVIVEWLAKMAGGFGWVWLLKKLNKVPMTPNPQPPIKAT